MSSYTIKVAETGDYIVIKVFGEIDREFAMEYSRESNKIAAKMGIHKFLVDATEAVNVETTVGNYNFVQKDLNEAKDINKKAQVATLVSPDDDSHNFIETVTVNRGYNVRQFQDREEALNFLGVKE